MAVGPLRACQHRSPTALATGSSAGVPRPRATCCVARSISTPSTLALTREVSVGRAILDRRAIQAETDEYPEGSDRARRDGVRTVLIVPLIPAGKTIGVILIRCTKARLFSDRQIALLQTFADQAVIAIENTRLFE